MTEHLEQSLVTNNQKHSPPSQTKKQSNKETPQEAQQIILSISYSLSYQIHFITNQKSQNKDKMLTSASLFSNMYVPDPPPSANHAQTKHFHTVVT